MNIRLEIEKFSKFCSSEMAYINSEYIIYQMVKFNINAKLLKSKEDDEFHLSFFLNCDGDEKK